MKRVAVVVVSYNTRDLTLRALRSLPEPGPLPGGGELEVIVVDNASEDGSPAAVVAQHPKVRLLEPGENLGFGRANNLAMANSGADTFLLLNSDAYLQHPHDLERMAELLHQRPQRGVLGPRIVSEDGSLQYSARSFPSVGREMVRRLFLYRIPFPGLRRRLTGSLYGEFFPHTHPTDVDWVVGACMAVKRRVWEEVGGFDPEIFMYGEEQEWCARIRQAHWEVHFHPEVEVVHRKAASSGAARARWRMQAALKGDLRVVRTLRGHGYTVLFAGVRTLTTFFHAFVASLLALLTSSGEWKARRDESWLMAREHTLLLMGGGGS